MTIPQVVDRRSAAKLASPNETHAVRVLVHKVSHPGTYTLRCRQRRYMFERCGISGAHILDIPASVWMDGLPKSGPYRDNTSISHDLQPTVAFPLTIQIVPWQAAKPISAPAAAADVFPLLASLMEKLAAPPVVLRALAIAGQGSIDELRSFIDGIEVRTKETAQAAEINPKTGEPYTAAELRAKKMRDAKAAARKSQLQPA